MVRFIITGITALLIGLSQSAYSRTNYPNNPNYPQGQGKFKGKTGLRIMGGGGRTFVDTTIGNGNKSNYRFGLELIRMMDEPSINPNVGLLLELGYSQLYKQDNSGVTRKASYITLLNAWELTFFDFYIIRLGYGAYFGVGDRAEEVEFALHLGMGPKIKLSDNVSIPIIFRVDWVFDSNTATVITLTTGLSYYFLK